MKFKVGQQVTWDDPSINDYSKELDRIEARNRVWTIDSIDEDRDIYLISDEYSEAEVPMCELRPIFKVGDKVKVKSLEWYKASRKQGEGHVLTGSIRFLAGMCHLCGGIYEVKDTSVGHYLIGGYWLDPEAIEEFIGGVNPSKLCDGDDINN